jgi:hypothetical protein
MLSDGQVIDPILCIHPGKAKIKSQKLKIIPNFLLSQHIGKFT